MDIISIGSAPRFVLGDPQSKDSPLRPIYGPPNKQGGRRLVGWAIREREEGLCAAFDKYDEAMDALPPTEPKADA